MINKLRKLDPREFMYEDHELNWWSVFGLSFSESIELDKLIDKINEHAVGYCDGSIVRFRPRENSYAVMFEVKGERFWFHIEESENEAIVDFLNRIRD